MGSNMFKAVKEHRQIQKDKSVTEGSGIPDIDLQHYKSGQICSMKSIMRPGIPLGLFFVLSRHFCLS